MTQTFFANFRSGNMDSPPNLLAIRRSSAREDDGRAHDAPAGEGPCWCVVLGSPGRAQDTMAMLWRRILRSLVNVPRHARTVSLRRLDLQRLPSRGECVTGWWRSGSASRWSQGWRSMLRGAVSGARGGVKWWGFGSAQGYYARSTRLAEAAATAGGGAAAQGYEAAPT